jgi:hypothetical protein
VRPGARQRSTVPRVQANEKRPIAAGGVTQHAARDAPAAVRGLGIEEQRLAGERRRRGAQAPPRVR